MQNRVIVGNVLAGLIAFAPGMVRADSTSSPGKFAAATSVTGVDFDPAPPSHTLTVQLTKGKGKRMLIVTGMAAATGLSGTSRLYLRTPTANGVNMEPQPANLAVRCDAFTVPQCSVSSTWWLDLDQADAASPGTFIGVPIDVNLDIEVDSCDSLGDCPGALVSGSMTAQQVKK